MTRRRRQNRESAMERQVAPASGAEGKPWLMILAPAVLGGTIFAATLANGFVYDDKWTLDRLANLSHSSVKGLFLSGRGLTYAVHLMDYHLWGHWAPGFHITNTLLHCFASSLAAFAAYRLARAARIGLLCGLLFASHPVHVEAVALFSYRKDILAMIFGTLALILWLRAPGWKHQLASTACLALALLSKETSAIGYVPMLFMADLLPCGDNTFRHRLHRAFCRSLPLWGAGLLAAWWFVGDPLEYFQPPFLSRVVRGGIESYPQVLAVSASAVPEAARLLLLPIRLAADYPLPEHTPQQVCLGLGITSIWLLTGVALWKRAPVVSYGLAWTAICYLPYSNILPLGGFIVADRYLYVSSFGICLVLAVGLDWLLSAARRVPRPLGLAVSLGVICIPLAFSVRSFGRCRDWHSDVSLWSSAVRSGFGSVRIHYNLGNAWRRQGATQEAIAEYQTALAIDPQHQKAAANLANALHSLGHYEEAIRAYAWATRLDSHNPTLYCNWGQALFQVDRLDEAQEAFSTAVRLSSTYSDAYYGLGNVLRAQQHFTDAAAAYQSAIDLAPHMPLPHYHLANTLAALGQLDDALTQYDLAIEYMQERRGAGVGTVLSGMKRQREAVLAARAAAIGDRSHD